jgi:dipeptidyl aminopeptidase/acylaminoacyl peptidase
MLKMIMPVLAVVLIVCSSVSAQKSGFTIEDIYKIKNVGSQTISHDGNKIAFTVTTSDFRKSKSNTDIYLMNSDGSEIRQITENPAAD